MAKLSAKLFLTVGLMAAPLTPTLSITSAFAYETDQVSHRDFDFPDAQMAIDEKIAEMLENARSHVLATTGAHQSDQEIGWRLRAAIYEQNPVLWTIFGAPIEEWMGKELLPKGYSISSHAGGKERSIYALYRRQFNGPLDLIKPQAFNLAEKFTGEIVTPTFNANGVLFGGDKLTHFFRLGYRYWKKSNWGKNVGEALKYGTSTENGFIGMTVIGVFSYADLAANYDGYIFYRDLTGTENAHYEIVRRPEVDAKGRKQTVLDLVLKRPFRIAEYNHEDWDEYFNPPAYSPALRKAVTTQLEAERDLFCGEFRHWRNTRGTPRVSLRDHREYVHLPEAPPQIDPYQLEKLCESYTSAESPLGN